MAEDDPIVNVRQLGKRFEDKVALKDLSFEIRRGEVLGLLGVNGAGKTTAMNIMLGLLKPTSGSVLMFGKELAKHRIEILKKCNFSSAYTGLPSNLLVSQNLDVFARLYGVKRRRERIREVLEMFEIDQLEKRVTGELSAGEGTRVNLAKAMLNKPKLLLLDEPTASLDPDIADKVRKMVRRVQEEEGLSVLYTSHNMKDVEEVCDRLIFLHKGGVLTEGSPEEVLEEFSEESMEKLFIRVARSGEFIEPEASDES